MAFVTEDGTRASLHRWPPRDADPLRAWDAADTYLLRRLAEDHPPSLAPGLLLANDAFGALAVGTPSRRSVVWNDSHLGFLALCHNLRINGRPDDAVEFVRGDRDPIGPWSLAVIRIPKSLDHFTDQLHRLRDVLAPGAVLLSGSMIKHTSSRAYRLLEDIIGPTTTSLGWKKARLAESRLDAGHQPPRPRRPATFSLPDLELVIHGRNGVFSAGRLDGGTRLMLQHLPEAGRGASVVDLGCGSGVLALAMARRHPDAVILGIDASYLAVTNARENKSANRALLGRAFDRLAFSVADGLADALPGSVDLIVCNPPFHQDRAVGDHQVRRLIGHAHRALRPGGVLQVVGNRHLGHHVKLQRVFGSMQVVASDRRFVVLRSVRSGDTTAPGETGPACAGPSSA